MFCELMVNVKLHFLNLEFAVTKIVKMWITWAINKRGNIEIEIVKELELFNLQHIYLAYSMILGNLFLALLSNNQEINNWASSLW